MKRIFRIVLVGLVALASQNVRGADEDEAELKKVEGRYERLIRNQAGTTFRAVKEEFGGQSIVTTYDDVGNVVVAHTSTYKVEKRGPVRVFSFFNLVVTAGPNKGATDPATNSYIYRVDDHTFTEVWGMLDGDPNPPQFLVWKRIKEAK